MEKREHEFCLRCGRRLKNPIAREKGYGAICEKKLRITDTRKLFECNTSGINEKAPNLQSS